MAINVKCRFVFESGGYGWQESYWMIADSLEKARDVAKELQFVRRELLSTDAKIVTRTVSDESVRGDSDVVWPEAAHHRALPKPTLGPWEGVLIRTQGRDQGGTPQFLYKASHFLRGVPASAFYNDGADSYKYDDDWFGALNLYLNFLKTAANGMVMKIRKKDTPIKPIEGLAASTIIGNTTYKITGHGLLFSDRVLVHGFTGKQKPLNGHRYIIRKVDDDHFDVTDKFPGDVDFVPGAQLADPLAIGGFKYVGPNVQKDVNTFAQIKVAELVRPAVHKTSKSKTVGPAAKKKRTAILGS